MNAEILRLNKTKSIIKNVFPKSRVLGPPNVFIVLVHNWTSKCNYEIPVVHKITLENLEFRWRIDNRVLIKYYLVNI